MGLRYKRADLEGTIRSLAAANSEFKGMITKEMESIRPAIQASMEFHSDAEKGRVSGDMVDAMDTQVAGLQLRFGFLKKLQDYFQYQTITGFTHWGSGKYIEPSLALSDAKLDAQELMQEASVRIRRNFMARLRRR